MIYGKIISAAILMTKGQFGEHASYKLARRARLKVTIRSGTAVEMLRQVVNLHDEGNLKWAHEDQSVRVSIARARPSACRHAC